MGRPFDMERKGRESSIHDNDIDFCVTMVWWLDVPDTDQGDFRRQRAVDIYICHKFRHHYRTDWVVVLS